VCKLIFIQEFVPSTRRSHKGELAVGYVDGNTLEEGVVADTDIYLDYLVDKVKKMRVQVVIKEVSLQQSQVGCGAEYLYSHLLTLSSYLFVYTFCAIGKGYTRDL
jgi:hypothetical protein